MFNIGPLEMVILAIVALVVIGPDKLPGLAKDAANMLRTLRDLATGARKQLRDELGPEFADVDFRNFNPRTVVTRAVFGDEFDPSKLNPRNAVRNAVFGEDDWREDLKKDFRDSDPRQAVRDARESLYGDEPSRNGGSANGSSNGHAARDSSVRMSKPISTTKPVSSPVTPQAARPRPRPSTARPATPYDADAT